VVKRVDLAYQAFFRRVEEGNDPGYPRFLVHEEKALAKAQRRLSQAAKGTPDRAKSLKVVHRIHERITNRREDFVQKI